MGNDKPTVVVTEVDRRAAWAALRWSATSGSPFSDWFATGQLPGEHWDEQEVTDLVAVAQAIAHARTMAAFEERVSCAFKLAQVCDEIQFSVVVGVAVDADQGPDMLTEDDIRALVLEGWGQ